MCTGSIRVPKIGPKWPNRALHTLSGAYHRNYWANLAIQKPFESSWPIGVHWLGHLTIFPIWVPKIGPKRPIRALQTLSGAYLRNYWANFSDSKTIWKLLAHRCALAWSFDPFPHSSAQNWPKKAHSRTSNFVRSISQQLLARFSRIKNHFN